MAPNGQLHEPYRLWGRPATIATFRERGAITNSVANGDCCRGIVPRPLLLVLKEPVDRTLDLPEITLGHVGVDDGRGDLLVSK